MVTSKWFKDSCPYCKDQGFLSVVGDVETGESVIGFQHVQSGNVTGAHQPVDTIAFKDQTLTSGGKVTNMADTDYKVFALRSSSTTGTTGCTGAQAVITNISAQKKESFGFQGEGGQVYDLVVRGRILY